MSNKDTKKSILFLTGTRADFGKLKPLMQQVENDPRFQCLIFVTGMHTLRKYGLTVDEVYKAGFRNIHLFMNQISGDPMDLVLANTITGLSRYVTEYKPDLIVVHGDRVEALAGAIVGSLNNILVAHIEGGELSGTIDGLIRHSVSKLSHLHFVSNQEAAARLRQLGEGSETIFTIGSPDVDVMLSDGLPTIEEVRRYYNISFREYGILAYHPVTTELESIYDDTLQLTQALIDSRRNYIVIYPNNDEGSSEIFRAYKAFEGNPRFKIFPSMRFEYFLTLLKHCRFMIGNSSAGIREAPIYGKYSINVGTRQADRFSYGSILNTGYGKEEIGRAIEQIGHLPNMQPCLVFGTGDSALRFIDILRGEDIWGIRKQKQFVDLKTG